MLFFFCVSLPVVSVCYFKVFVYSGVYLFEPRETPPKYVCVFFVYSVFVFVVFVVFVVFTKELFFFFL